MKLRLMKWLLPVFMMMGTHYALAAEEIPMYRVYNPHNGEHFYTGNREERDQLVTIGWQDEGIGWFAPHQGDAVYRLYAPLSGDHHYTLSAAERDMLVTLGWQDEGVGWFSDLQKTYPMYRIYNPYALVGSHHYTVNQHERDQLVTLGWQDEGIGWYAVNLLELTAQPHIEVHPEITLAYADILSKPGGKRINNDGFISGTAPDGTPLVLDENVFGVILWSKTINTQFDHTLVQWKYVYPDGSSYTFPEQTLVIIDKTKAPAFNE